MAEQPQSLHGTVGLERAVSSIPVFAGNEESALSSAELSTARRLAGRVRDELTGVLGSMPPGARRASGLARAIGVERTVCQRMVSALNADADDPQLLTRLPGVRSLQAIIEGVRGAGADPQEADAAGAAIGLLNEFYQRVGGSQAAFARRLARTRLDRPGERRAGAAGDAQDAIALAGIAHRLLGRWSRVQIQTAVYSPDPDHPGSMLTGRMRGFVGHRARADAMPLIMMTRKTGSTGAAAGEREFEPLFEPDAGSLEDPDAPFVATPFCSVGGLRLAIRRRAGSMVQVIDPPEADDEQGYDLVTCDRSISSVPLPEFDTPPVHEVWAVVDYPASGLLMDVWLHKDIARRCLPDLSVHLHRMNLFETVGQRWYSKLPGGPALRVLGFGLEGAGSALWDRHAESLAWLFDGLGWDPNQFVGYRCEVTDPLWRVGYLMSFDFTRPDSPSERADTD